MTFFSAPKSTLVVWLLETGLHGAQLRGVVCGWALQRHWQRGDGWVEPGLGKQELNQGLNGTEEPGMGCRNDTLWKCLVISKETGCNFYCMSWPWFSCLFSEDHFPLRASRGWGWYSWVGGAVSAGTKAREDGLRGQEK